jgi:hypothetical protein
LVLLGPPHSPAYLAVHFLNETPCCQQEAPYQRAKLLRGLCFITGFRIDIGRERRAGIVGTARSRGIVDCACCSNRRDLPIGLQHSARRAIEHDPCLNTGLFGESEEGFVDRFVTDRGLPLLASHLSWQGCEKDVLTIVLSAILIVGGQMRHWQRTT